MLPMSFFFLWAIDGQPGSLRACLCIPFFFFSFLKQPLTLYVQYMYR